MRHRIHELVGIFAKANILELPIYEFGSYQVEGQEWADLRKLFPGKEYVGADMREGNGVDVSLDLHNIDLPDNSVGAVICVDTLEHVEDPRKAMNEIYRILKPGGRVLITSVMNCPIHNCPHDYWRFTPEAFNSIMNEFRSTIILSAGKESFPHTIVGYGTKLHCNHNDRVIDELISWKEKHSKPKKLNIRQKIKLFIPPIIFNAYKKLR